MLKASNLCINCLRPGHFVKGCKSLRKCKVCQKPHHSLLHVGEKSDPPPGNETPGVPPPTAPILSHATMGIRSDLLLMTCRVLVQSSNGSTMEARAILDSGSTASFVSE